MINVNIGSWSRMRLRPGDKLPEKKEVAPAQFKNVDGVDRQFLDDLSIQRAHSESIKEVWDTKEFIDGQ